MDLEAEGARKYGDGDVIGSSRPLAWSGLVADLRHHPAGELPAFTPSHLEIGIATACHAASAVARTGDGREQRTKVEPGIAWLCPAGVQERDIHISHWHEVLHVYLPPARFAQYSEQRGGIDVRSDSVRYLGGLHDATVRESAWRLLAEMQRPTSASHMRADAIALALTERLAEHYTGAASPGRSSTRAMLDERRLRRVLDYMAEHLEDDVGIDALAAIACLSPFHFVRMFARRMGMPPHRYFGRLRLERAKTLLALGRVPLAQIALASCFSSQSNFSRAFRRATGMTPLSYRRAARTDFAFACASIHSAPAALPDRSVTPLAASAK